MIGDSNLNDIILSNFGEDVTRKYGLPPQVSVSLRAVFDSLYAEMNGVVSTAPALQMRKTDLPDMNKTRDLYIVRGTEYAVAEYRQDHTGMVVIILRKA